MLRYLFLDINAFFASVEQQERPELRGRPVAVVPLLADTTSCIAASYEARAFGVKTGTRVANARKLCPELAIIQARPKLYVEYHHRILEAMSTCMPIDRVYSVDEMGFKLYGREQQPERAEEIAAQMKETLRREIGPAVRCSIGIAPNRFLAKTASNIKKPDGCTVIQLHDLPDCLYSLDLGDITGIGRSMLRRLRELRITTVEQLCKASRGMLRMAWGGVTGERMYANLRGENIEVPQRERQSIGHSCVLAPDLRTVDSAFAILNKLAQKVVQRLRSHELLAGALHLSVRHIRTRSWRRDAIITPTDCTTTLLSHLSTLRKEYPVSDAIPFAVAITLVRLTPRAAEQLSLFDAAAGSSADSNGHASGAALVNDAIDKALKKFGPGTLYFGGAHQVRNAAPMRIPFNRVPNPALEQWEAEE